MKTPFDDLFPDTLFESCVCYENKICLVCGSAKAISTLRTTTITIFPICRNCSFNWNVYGYEVFKKIKPKKLILNIIKFKLTHPFFDSIISIYKNFKVIKSWSTKIKKYLKMSQHG